MKLAKFVACVLTAAMLGQSVLSIAPQDARAVIGGYSTFFVAFLALLYAADLVSFEMVRRERRRPQ